MKSKYSETRRRGYDRGGYHGVRSKPSFIRPPYQARIDVQSAPPPGNRLSTQFVRSVVAPRSSLPLRRGSEFVLETRVRRTPPLGVKRVYETPGVQVL